MNWWSWNNTFKYDQGHIHVIMNYFMALDAGEMIKMAHIKRFNLLIEKQCVSLFSVLELMVDYLTDFFWCVKFAWYGLMFSEGCFIGYKRNFWFVLDEAKCRRMATRLAKCQKLGKLWRSGTQLSEIQRKERQGIDFLYFRCENILEQLPCLSESHLVDQCNEDKFDRFRF